jgi:hypothetical protein
MLPADNQDHGCPRIFVSYSHRDEVWKNLVVQHLRVLEPEGAFEVWEDRRIAAGADWLPEITTAINSAAVAVMLVSVDFLGSKFILGEEIPRLLKRRAQDGLRLVPLIVRPCAWQGVSWISEIQGRPKDGAALSGMQEAEAEEALSRFALEIRNLLAAARVSERKSSFAPGSDGMAIVKSVPAAKETEKSEDAGGLRLDQIERRVPQPAGIVIAPPLPTVSRPSRVRWPWIGWGIVFLVAAAVIFDTAMHGFVSPYGRTRLPTTVPETPPQPPPKSTEPAKTKNSVPGSKGNLLSRGSTTTSPNSAHETPPQSSRKSEVKPAKKRKDSSQTAERTRVTPFPDTYLTASLELPDKVDFRAFKYQPIISVTGKTYIRGIYLRSEDKVPGVVKYRIPRGAKTFVVTSIARQEGGCTNSDADGWEVRLTTSKCDIAKPITWQYGDPQFLEIPVDNLLENDRVLAITVNPLSNGTCDHSALVNPHFTSKAVSTEARKLLTCNK